MKLVNYEEFCKLPEWTVFAPYKPCVLLEDLAIKTDGGDKEGHFNGVINIVPSFGQDTMLFNIGDEEPLTIEEYDGDQNDYKEYNMFLVLDAEDIRTMYDLWETILKHCIFKLKD